MPSLKVAHINEQGNDLIIVPLGETFGTQPDRDRCEAIRMVQQAAKDAGLAGTVVPVWPSGDESLRFVAPKPWHPFFRSINWPWLLGNLNREVTW